MASAPFASFAPDSGALVASPPPPPPALAAADEQRRKSSVTVRVLRAGDVDKLASARANDDGDKPKPGGKSLGVVDVSTPVDVNLYWMKDVLKHMKKFTPTVPKLPAGFGRSGATWFFHTAKSRKAMANNFNDVLLPSIREGLSDDKDAPLRGGALYLDGKKLAEDPEECGFPGYCHEYQRVCTWAIDEGIPFVFVGAGERYDEEAWRGIRTRPRRSPRDSRCERHSSPTSSSPSPPSTQTPGDDRRKFNF